MSDVANRVFRAGKLEVRVYGDRGALGRAAGAAVAARIRALQSAKRVGVVFAAAPSQNEFLEALAAAPGIDWSRVVAYHMDEYVGLPGTAPQSFGRWLSQRLFDRVRPGAVHLIDGMAAAPEAECARYAALLKQAPPDVTCLGIGENGHLAFNDPPVADFEDPRAVKPVALDEASRRQQVNDGCFPSIEAVPRTAVTLTIPTLLSAPSVFCMVPGPLKAKAVKAALEGPVESSCPASVLRRHPDAVLFLDDDAARLADTAIAKG